MFEALGTVIALVPPRFLLVEFDEVRPNREEEMLVVGKATLPLSEGELPVQTIFVPKGTVRISLEQDDLIYLAEVFREDVQRTRRTHKSGNAFSAMFLPSEEVTEYAKGDWSGTLAIGKDAKPLVSNRIQVGDLVGRAEDHL